MWRTVTETVRNGLDSASGPALNGRMSRHDPRIDDYIAQAAPFARPILERLREQVLAAG